ncbi:hypothetical protein F5Y14DRAFT_441962 [Nemania sp. NC0429]|nr:hypothetical protein F5Y14DRAFT_441962 [Nemania sp. NC0429]
MASPDTSITSKEWVIPPRPKPGRKPATDTPPTKRKAQNRAAQRAFRERRAARVGELEEELEEQREEHERIQQQLHRQVERLNAEVDSLRGQNGALMETLEKERAERAATASELESLQRRWQDEVASIPSRNGSFMSLQGRIQSFSSQHQSPNVPQQRNSTTSLSIQQIISPPESSASSASLPQALQDVADCGGCHATGSCACVDDVLAGTAVECGKCALGTRCECLEAALNIPAPGVEAGAETELKRKSSSIPALAPEEKRQRAESYPNEIDFTAMFSSSKKKAPTATPASTEPPPVSLPAFPPREPCGFCTESSYCVCAETAAAQALPPMSQQVQTPPSSEDDVEPTPMEIISTGAVKLPSLRSLDRNSFQAARKPSGCGTSGPGTCSQCLRDPKSGLFCRSLAAAFSRESGTASGGCCGGSAGSGCCKSANPPAQAPNSSFEVSLSCADAYQTLSRHPGFERATDEFGTWLPKLKAIPKPANAFGRTALEVETASIMGVLKEFDVRFGRNE